MSAPLWIRITVSVGNVLFVWAALTGRLDRLSRQWYRFTWRWPFVRRCGRSPSLEELRALREGRFPIERVRANRAGRQMLCGMHHVVPRWYEKIPVVGTWLHEQEDLRSHEGREPKTRALRCANRARPWWKRRAL